MKINIIFRVSFWLSILVAIVGFYLGKHTYVVLKYYIQFLKAFPYGFIIFVASLGFPMSWLNTVECNQLWSRVFNRRAIEFIGITGGIFLGMISLW
jgi:hypothetical protein